MDDMDFRTPGQLIEHLVQERGWTQAFLAELLGVGTTVVSKLIGDKRPVDAPMALALGEVFGTEAERFLALQKAYDLAKARLVHRADPGRSTRARLFGELPVGEMIQRAWLAPPDPKDARSIERELAKFFGVESADDIEVLPHAPKKTYVATPATPVQLAWLYRVRQIAQEMIAPRCTPTSVRGAVDRLGALLWAAEEIRHVPRILMEAGVRFVIVETLPSAKIDGVTFWLDDTAPVIGMSMRYDRIDNFWFVLRHELEHVARGHGRAAAMLDAELEGERAGAGPHVTEEERDANAAAAEFCVPQATLDRFIALKAPFFSERDVVGFARTIKVHPGLVVGQLQHRLKKYDRFRQHQVKVRSIVAPSATVDGWGEVAPVGE